MVNWATGTVEARNVDQSEIFGEGSGFAIDTSLSWEGTFPPPGEGDWLIEVGSINGDRTVLVSRRYVGATDDKNAAEIALNAVTEREGFDTDDNGDPLPVEINGETGIPVWINRVRRVVGDSPPEVTCELIDVCLCDYFQGWSHRKGPHFAVGVSNESTWQEIRDSLADQCLMSCDEFPDNVTDEQIEAAIDEIFDGFDMDEINDFGLPDDCTPEDSESYAYFGFTIE